MKHVLTNSFSLTRHLLVILVVTEYIAVRLHKLLGTGEDPHLLVILVVI